MRTTRIALALALLVSPAILSAQATDVTDVCSATAPSSGPTCNRTKDVTTTIGNVLYLGIRSNGPIQLLPLVAGSDTAAYEKTWRANGKAPVASLGAAVSTPAMLQDAAATDSVVVLANRGYQLTIKGQSNIFTFDKDAGYATCRTTAVATSGCTSTTGTDGKPVTDLYWSTDATTFAQVPLPSSPVAIRNVMVGERYAKEVSFKSAWFYATDIPGKYTATVVYTVTGQ